jgi:hypothetical protein
LLPNAMPTLYSMNKKAAQFSSFAKWVVLTVLGSLSCAHIHAQDFVIPALRGTGTQADFAYWDLFARPPGSSSSVNYNFANRPALADGLGRDSNLNPTTVLMPSPTPPRATFMQTLTPNCFVTSSSALYSFNSVLGFEVSYAPLSTTAGNVQNVIFQIQSGGSRPLDSSVKIRYLHGGNPVFVSPIYRALDDLQTGAFGERVVFGYQWNLTGLGIRDFKVVFRSEGSSMALWQSQLDATVGVPFQQALGYLLSNTSAPVTRFGKPGTVSASYGAGVDGRFFLQGQQITLEGLGSSDWEPVGLVVQGAVIDQATHTFTFPAANETVKGLFAPLTYQAWRDRMFHHANSLTGTLDDYTNNSVSGPEVDHDRDGLSNQAEYAFGCDPYVSDHSRGQGSYHTVTVSGITYPAFTYRSNGAPELYSDLAFTVEQSSDLQQWSNAGVVSHSSVRQTDGTQMVTVRTAQPVIAYQRCFLRVKVESL